MLLRVLIILLSVTLCACHHARTRTDMAARKFYHGHYHDAFHDALVAAYAGDAQAQYAVGYMYYYGKGVIANDKLAKKWFNAAALQGHPDAHRALKLMR